MLVSSVSTVWSGLEIPPYAKRAHRRDWRGHGIQLARGVELARFEMGSTAIALFPNADPAPQLGPETAVTVGRSLGHLSPAVNQGTIMRSGVSNGSA
jgi:phosphatidylserine decarboxylase